jgi:hypothetical protein
MFKVQGHSIIPFLRNRKQGLREGRRGRERQPKKQREKGRR